MSGNRKVDGFTELIERIDEKVCDDCGSAWCELLRDCRSRLLSQLERVAALEAMIIEVYNQAGNESSPSRRHALTPEIRDKMRDYLKSIGYWQRALLRDSTDHIRDQTNNGDL